MNVFIERHMRHELKYRIDNLQYQLLRKKLSAVLRHDDHSGPDGKYHIRNLYFDDFRNTALSEKLDGVAYRKKWRMRIYNDSDTFIKFECKAKLNDYILKQSVRLTREEAERIIAGKVEFLKNSQVKLLKEFCWECRRNLIHPVVIVDYHREAYVYPIGNVRVTFDMQLRTGLGPTAFFDPGACTISVADEPGVILEVKYNDILPQHIRGLFPTNIRPRSAIGKFAICRTQQMNRLGNPTTQPLKLIKPPTATTNQNPQPTAKITPQTSPEKTPTNLPIPILKTA